MSDNEIAELLWENGQAVVHGRKKYNSTPFPPFGGGSSSRGVQEKHAGGEFARAHKLSAFSFAATAPPVHDFPAGLDATHEDGDDDTVPWIHYPIIDDVENGSHAPALTADYCSDFFSELQQAGTANLSSLPPSHHNGNITQIAPSCREPSKESHGLSAPAIRSEQTRQSGGGGEGVMNFSLFSRPAAMAMARATATLQSVQRPQGTDKTSNVTASNHVESTVVQAANAPRSTPIFTDQRTPWSQPQELHFASAAAAAPQAAVTNLQQETTGDKAEKNMVVQKDEARKAPDNTVATSSVCSGNGARNDETWRQPKRKSQAECSGSHDEDLEDEPGALRRSAAKRAKRSRTAEVHNLSERRRRDRINEKMRALQELIPNCNKIDKASMLDEAIEYLKTLQLQVQMMSMGSGLCIPPMLLPPTMQHLQIPPMAHFPHLGMGLGYGMGVFDMNSTPTIPLPAMPGAQFPCPMIPGMPQGLGMPGSSVVPMFGVPGQAVPISASPVLPFSSLAGLPVRPNLAPQVSGPLVNMAHEQQPSFATQQQQSLNLEARQEAKIGDPQIPIIAQSENQNFKAPSLAQPSNQFLRASSNGTNTTEKK